MKTVKEMIKAIYKHPRLGKKKVWAGLYGGHYDIIVFFSEKPKKSKDNFPLGCVNVPVWYSCWDNKGLIVADMSLCDFRQLYPHADISSFLKNGRPKEIEITEVFQVELEAVWDKNGVMDNFNTHVDW